MSYIFDSKYKNPFSFSTEKLRIPSTSFLNLVVLLYSIKLITSNPAVRFQILRVLNYIHAPVSLLFPFFSICLPCFNTLQHSFRQRLFVFLQCFPCDINFTWTKLLRGLLIPHVFNFHLWYRLQLPFYFSITCLFRRFLLSCFFLCSF